MSADRLLQIARGEPEQTVIDGEYQGPEAGRADHGGQRPNDDRSEAGGGKRRSQADEILELCAAAGLTYFRSRDGTAFVAVPNDDHVETWPVHSRGFRAWLAAQTYAITGKAPRAHVLADVIAVIDGRALHEGHEEAVGLRVAGDGKNEIEVDLGTADWTKARVTPHGWVIEPHGAQRFRRPRSMLALPTPVRGGTLAMLRKFVRVDDGAWSLLVAWIVAAMRPTGPYPVLLLVGEQGSCKTTTARLVRAVVDPVLAGIRAEPREQRDLAIAADNGHVVVLDNVSRVPTWLSDTLCRLSTGAAFATRTLHTNRDEELFEASRPALLTAITDVVSHADLLDRAVVVRLQAIPDDERRTESELTSAFEAVRPAIFGALLDAIVGALARLPEVERTMTTRPRMADFACLAVAAEPSYGVPAGTFMAAYGASRADTHRITLEATSVADPLRHLLADTEAWAGTASELLKALAAHSDETTRRARDWPGTGRGLSGILRRIAPSLRAVGVDVELDTREPGTGRRIVRISVRKGKGESTVTTVTPSQTLSPEAENRDGSVTVDRHADPKPSHRPSQRNPIARLTLDGRDGRDGAFAPSSFASIRGAVTDGDSARETL